MTFRPRRFRLPRHPLFHLALLATTALTTTFFGGILLEYGFRFGYGEAVERALQDPAVWHTGLLFALPLLLILGVHETGHWLACRHYGLPATLPYFLPVPFGIGTFGAVIRIRAPITRKKELFDVGASGPLAGFFVALPVLLWGIAHSKVAAAIPPGDRIVLNPSPLVAWGIAKFLPGGAPGQMVDLAPEAVAGWFGMLVTALNLLPLAQLDGGHVLYAVAGRFQRTIGYGLFALLVGLAFLWQGWIVWIVVVLLMGIAHPPTEDTAERLDATRLLLALACLIVFLLCFTPVPFDEASPERPAPAPARPVKTYNL